MVTSPSARHPLRLPAGSIRAMLAMLIAGLFWTLLLLPPERGVPIPLFLYFLFGMILLFFFAHGNTIAAHEQQPPPWSLPRGTFRVLILLGTAAVIGLHFYLHGGSPLNRLAPKPEQLEQWPLLLASMLSGLALGWLIGHGPWRHAAAFQDIQAWVSLLAMLGLVAEVLFVLVINPNLKERSPVDLSTMECVLTGIVAWYFGARS